MQVRHFLPPFPADVKRKFVPVNPLLFREPLGLQDQHAGNVGGLGGHIGNRSNKVLWYEQ